MGAFKVLMWKHYTVRKRRLFQTLVELIAPISMMLVLYILKDSMQKKSGGLRTSSLKVKHGFIGIVYTYANPSGFSFDFKSSTGQMERNDSLILGALTQKILISIDTYQRLGTSDIMVSTMMFEVDLRRTALHRFCPTAQARAEAYLSLETLRV